MKIRQKEFDRELIKEALAKVKPGLKKYIYLRNMLKVVNVSTDGQFQKTFNGFYKMRQRPKDFYKIFYSFMEENKRNSPSFEEILLYIYTHTGRVEASFSSKLVATINPDLPILDKFVLTNLGLSLPGYHSKNRLEKVVSIYQEIIEWYKVFLNQEKVGEIIDMFDTVYPNSGITNIKKVDFIVWQIR